MTQPAAHLPAERSDDVGNGPGPHDPERLAGGGGLRRAALTAAFGVPVGLLWWVLAPSGLNILSGDPALRNGSNLETWLPRDLVLAGLFLLAGCIAGALGSGTKHQEPSSKDVVLAVAAGMAGALLAWGTGVLSGLWWGTPEDASTNASVAFSLRSYAVLAIWPGAIALAIFAGRLFAAPRKPASGEPTA